MAKRPTISSVPQTLTNTVTINNNFEAIQEAFDNTLSRDGSTPNQMNANLDMNGYSILNVLGINIDGEDFFESVEELVGQTEAARDAAVAAQDSAESSATSSAASATNASASASSASTSATNASESSSSASTSASSASTSATDAASSASAAASSATSASTSASSASTSATDAASSASSASSSATSATTSATSAASSAVSSSSSATSAATSASEAEASAAAIQPYDSRAAAVAAWASRPASVKRMAWVGPLGAVYSISYSSGSSIIPDFSDAVPETPRAHLAVWGVAGSGLVDDRSAVLSALASGWPLTGEGLLVGVAGDVLLTACDMQDVKFKQLSPAGTRRTLDGTSLDGLRLVRVSVDIGGDGTNNGELEASGVNGFINTCYGMYFNGITNSHLEDIEVYGDDSCTGIYLLNMDGTNRVIRPWVHDINFVRSAATDDTIQGIQLQITRNLIIDSPKVERLTCTVPGKADRRHTRCIAGGNNVFTRVNNPYCYYADQGVDLTGGDGNIGCIVHNGISREILVWGFKLANSALRCEVAYCTAINCGVGFVASGNAALDPEKRTDRSRFSHCLSLNAGNLGGDTAVVGIAGFRVLSSGTDAGSATNIEFIYCRAEDNQNVKTMTNGFASETSTAVAPFAKGCESIGHTSSAFQGNWKRPHAGSNANGSYEIDDNGTLTCRLTVDEVSVDWSTVNGAVFSRASSYNWTLPYVFAATPVVSGSITRGGIQVGGIATAGVSTTSVLVMPWIAQSAPAGNSKSMSIVAIGKAW